MLYWNRRNFVKTSILGTAAFTLLPSCKEKTSSEVKNEQPRFKISLAQWSLHNAIFAKQLDHLDFAKKATEFGIYAVEYVNQFFPGKATDSAYLEEMNMRARDFGVNQLLIMIDGEGGLADLDDSRREETVKNHYKWVDAAKILGCHSIRVNAYGTSEDRNGLHASAVDGLGALSIYAQPLGINVIVENHGGLSSDGEWLSSVIQEVDMPNCGTLPDFGNFCVQREGGVQWEARCINEYDRYRGVKELLPFARGVSAKSYDFDEQGNETTINYSKMLDIIKESSYAGYIGVEYEGTRLSEDEGIRATKALLDKLIG